MSSSTKSVAIDAEDLHPFMGILKHTNSTARGLYVSYQKISRDISTS